jgi:hypothetical protein
MLKVAAKCAARIYTAVRPWRLLQPSLIRRNFAFWRPE